MTWCAETEIQAANCHGTLTVGGVSLNRSALAVLNVATLWEPAPPRGENLLIPFSAGRMSFARMRDERAGSLQMLVVGTVDVNGTRNPDPYIGLEENIGWLNANLFAPAETMTPFNAVLTMPSGAQKQGPIQFGAVQFGWEIAMATTLTVDFVLPRGCLQ